jgi:hypothetical protein
LGETILKSQKLFTALKLHWYNFALLFRETEDAADSEVVQRMKEKEIANELLSVLGKAAVPLSVFFGKMRMLEELVPLAEELQKKWKV